MNLDPFNMPSFGSNPGARLQGDINSLAPLATQYHGPLPSPDIQQYVATPSAGSPSNIAKFGHFLGGVASGIGHLTASVAGWLGKQTENMVEAPFRYGAGLAHGLLDRSDLSQVNSQLAANSARLDTLNSLYKSGRISQDQFKLELKDLNSDMDNLVRQSTSLNNRIGIDQTDTIKSSIDTAATLVTILTAGFGRAATVALTKNGAAPIGEGVAADFLGSKSADELFAESEAALRKVAVNGENFGRLSPAARDALQKTVADVVAQPTSFLSGGQIARASAVNLAFKYPVYFNYLSSTAGQVYQELDQQKYGNAVRTTAFNALLMLSGGPIGQALKYGGKALQGISDATFGKTAYWDELSKFYGDGAADGFRQSASRIAAAIDDPVANKDFIKSIKPQYRAILTDYKSGKDFIKDLAANEATNMNAVGHDAVAAANRTAIGMKNNRYFADLTTFSHDEGLLDMANMSNAQRIASEEGIKAGLGPVTVGVVDARSLKGIADTITAQPRSRWTTAWNSLKKNSASWPWANNRNFDLQVKNLIKENKDPQALTEAITKIQASFTVKGFSEDVAKDLAKRGFMPINPVDLQAPFKEGVGKITSEFAGNDDFFIHASQPLPVLDHVGDLISRIGLSPNASTERTYQLFNQNVAANLNETTAARGIAEALGAEGKKVPDEMSDYMLKKLKSVKTKLPVRDYRMYTNKDIREALGVDSEQALEVQNAIAKAYFQVPMAVRGLGDRVVDSIYRARAPRALMSRYMKLQGALRFSFNPFFQYLRVIPKTEILSAAEGGGVINSIFAGRVGRLGEIRQALTKAGAFEKGGRFGNVLSGEATEAVGAAERNLGKKLLPMQERSIAGIIGAQADRLGMDYQTFIKNYPDKVRDTVQMIAEYDRKANFLNSPLARTLNVAFFPFRFETKVATIFARNLAKSSMMTQVAVVNGMLRAHDWLNSTEGQIWYSHNADAIGIFKYVSPVASLNEIFNSLLPGHDHHLGNFGELGGLPFGWIPQLLDAEGLTNFNAPGVNPKTGQVFPDYIPVTTKGQAAIAVQDFIGSLFSYPGATIGLPSKSSVTRNIAQGLTTAKSKTDFKLVTPVNLSPQQLSYSQTIQSLATTAPGANRVPLPTPPPLPGTTIPPQDSQVLHPLPKTTSLTAKRKKKSEYTPQLLPGQTTLGQL